MNEDLQHPVKHVEDNQASADRQAEYLNNVSSPKMSEEELIPRTFKQLDAEEVGQISSFPVVNIHSTCSVRNTSQLP